MEFPNPSLQLIRHPSVNNIKLTVKRDDLIHPVVSGNKLFKLSEYLNAFQEGQYATLITFGGAFSNHLHATAYACAELNIPCVAIIRGEQLVPLNPTLKDCVAQGMILEPVERFVYQKKEQSSLVQAILERYRKPLVIPEGGAGQLGVLGAARILEGVDQDQYDVIVCACGTGTTLAGIINGAQSRIEIIGIPVLKQAEKWMPDEIRAHLNSDNQNWSLWYDQHCGGYAKYNQDLTNFMDWSQRELNVPLDQVYTGKAFKAVMDKIAEGYWKKGTRILFIHTGGLQGARSLK